MARGGTGNVVPSIVGAEHIGPEATGDNIEAKRVAVYYWDSDTLTWERGIQSSGGSSSLAKASDAYGIQAISEDATYKYFWYEADDADYYIMRKNLATSVFSFTKGTGGYTTVYVDEDSGPSGTPVWASRGDTF